MVEEAKKFAAEDAKKKEIAEVMNTADSTIFTAEKLLRDFNDKLADKDKARTTELIAAVNSAKSGGKMEAIKHATDELSTHIQGLGAAMYQQGDSSATSGANKDEDVVDAEYSEA